MFDINRDNLGIVTVVIATTAEKKREHQLERAMNSILSQEGCEFNLLIIINGSRFDPALRKSIEQNKQVTCHYLTEGNFPKALMYARSKVDTEFFCFVDDDDELLPLSLANRLAGFSDGKKVDVVVGNGLKKATNSAELEMHPDILTYQQQPLEILTQQNGNWLASCAGMFRTETIPYEYFSDYATYAEWTYIAFKLAINKQVTFVKEPCYRINVNTESLSHNEAYLFGQYAMNNMLLGLKLPNHVRSSILIKRRDMEHEFSERFLREKQVLRAWFYHFKSLCNRNTFFKYFLFTRYLIKSIFKITKKS
jgi:glycosyltransferase involved in cell wall biosynthesis